MLLCLQANVEQNQEEEGKWATTKGMQYSARGRKLDYSRKAIYQMIFPLICWMLLVILNWGLSYMFVHQSIPRLDDVNGNSRVQAYSKHPKTHLASLSSIYLNQRQSLWCWQRIDAVISAVDVCDLPATSKTVLLTMMLINDLCI